MDGFSPHDLPLRRAAGVNRPVPSIHVLVTSSGILFDAPALFRDTEAPAEQLRRGNAGGLLATFITDIPAGQGVYQEFSALISRTG